MKVALLADIHGNADALGVILAEARDLGVTQLLIAGDLVGYYPFAARVFKLLESWDWISISGNHEAMLEDWRQGVNRKMILAKYGTAIKSTYETLSEVQVDMIVNCPHLLNLDVMGRNVLICHGAPWGRDEYVYPDAKEQTRERFCGKGLDLVVFGHTHYPVKWKVNETIIVNPGSAGQPRDRKPGACWALWNTVTNSVEFKRESYDMEPLIAHCKSTDPHLPFLWSVLTRTS